MRRLPLPPRLTAGILNFFYPASCPTCGAAPDTVSQAPFCSACWHAMRRITGPACDICGLPLVSVHADRCGSCRERPPAFRQARAFGVYETTLASAIHHLKFLGIRRLARPLASLLLFRDLSPVDAVVPVPLSRAGLRRRGFNQSLLLAYHLSRTTSKRLVMDALNKVAETPPQVGLAARERSANVRRAFACTAAVAGQRILLVDDVMTTGATADACARELLRAGAQSVDVVTLARADLRQ